MPPFLLISVTLSRETPKTEAQYTSNIIRVGQGTDKHVTSLEELHPHGWFFSGVDWWLLWELRSEVSHEYEQVCEWIGTSSHDDKE